MPAQTATAPVSLGAALRKHADAPAQARGDFTDLPPGIQGGVALLAKAAIGVFKDSENNRKSGVAGQRYIQLTAVVEAPQSHTWSPKRFANGQVVFDPPSTANVRGRQFSKLLPLCAETKKVKGVMATISAADNVNAALNEMKLLAGNECCNSLKRLPDNATVAQENAALNAILGAMVKAGIRFGFSTRAKDPTQAYPEPGSWPPDWGAPVVKAENNGQAPKGMQVPVGSVDQTEEAPPEEQPVEEEQPTEEFEEGGESGAADPTQGEDIEALVAQANKKVPAATKRLVELAVALGHDQAAVEAMDTWEEVAALLVPAEEGSAAEEEAPVEVVEEPPPWQPAKGEVYPYKPVKKNAAGKLVAGKAVDCKVTLVDVQNEKVDLLSTVDKKTQWRGVKWSALIREVGA